MSEKKRNVRTDINRLLELAEVVRELEPESFDMNSWFGWKNECSLDSDGRLKRLPKKIVHCKTVACIAGWATTVHPHLQIETVLDGSPVIRFREGATSMINEYAFSEAFGVTLDEACELTYFAAPHQKPEAAAKAIEKLAADLAERNGYEIVDA